MSSGAKSISEAGSIGLHTAAYLASRNGHLASASEIAAALHVSEAHLYKVLQRLVRVGIATSTRGPGGGYGLGRMPGKTRLIDVLEAVDGPFKGGSCLFGRKTCSAGRCVMGGALGRVNAMLREYFEGTTLAAFAGRKE